MFLKIKDNLQTRISISDENIFTFKVMSGLTDLNAQAHRWEYQAFHRRIDLCYLRNNQKFRPVPQTPEFELVESTSPESIGSH